MASMDCACSVHWLKALASISSDWQLCTPADMGNWLHHWHWVSCSLVLETNMWATAALKLSCTSRWLSEMQVHLLISLPLAECWVTLSPNCRWTGLSAWHCHAPRWNCSWVEHCHCGCDPWLTASWTSSHCWAAQATELSRHWVDWWTEVILLNGILTGPYHCLRTINCVE